MTISLSASPLWLLLCALIAAGLAVYSYRRTNVALSSGRRWVMGSIRGLAVFLLLLLLLRPVILHSETETEEPALAVLLDTSRSVPAAQGTDTSQVHLRQRLDDALNQLSALSPDAQLRLFTFHDELRSRGSLSEMDEPLTFDGHRTDIGSSLQQIEQQFLDQPLAGVIVFSDGHPTSGPDPLQVALQLPIPVHTVAVGDTSRPNDVYIERVETNERAFLDRETPVRVHLRSTGLAGEPFEVALLRDDTELDVTSIQASSDGQRSTVDFTFTPSETGHFQYRVEARALPEAAARDRITEIFSIHVQEEARRAMLVAGRPSPNVSALRQLLERELSLGLETHVQRPDGSFYEGPPTTPVDSLDLLIVAGYPTPATDPDVLASLEEFAQEIPIIFFADQDVDAATADALTNFLPIRPQGSAAEFAPEDVRLADGASQHPAFSHSPTSISWTDLPALHIPQRGWALTVDAQPLLVSEGGTPVVAVREFGGRRSAAVLASNTWQWMNLPPALASHADLWPTFARDLIQWTSADPADDAVTVTPTRSDFQETEEVSFEARIRESEEIDLQDIDVQVSAYASDGTTHSATLAPDEPGTYTGGLGTLDTGIYQYEATVRNAGETLAADQGSFSVGAFDPELDFAFANVGLLQQLSARTGGASVLLDEVGDLIPAISNTGALTASQHEYVRERVLWEWPLLLALVLILFSVEWLLRKRHGLP